MIGSDKMSEKGRLERIDPEHTALAEKLWEYTPDRECSSFENNGLSTDEWHGLYKLDIDEAPGFSAAVLASDGLGFLYLSLFKTVEEAELFMDAIEDNIEYP